MHKSSIQCRIIVFLKQKTAYEMRISDWSSDVCSSDLPIGRRARENELHERPEAKRQGACRSGPGRHGAMVQESIDTWATDRWAPGAIGWRAGSGHR